MFQWLLTTVHSFNCLLPSGPVPLHLEISSRLLHACCTLSKSRRLVFCMSKARLAPDQMIAATCLIDECLQWRQHDMIRIGLSKPTAKGTKASHTILSVTIVWSLRTTAIVAALPMSPFLTPSECNMHMHYMFLSHRYSKLTTYIETALKWPCLDANT